MKKKLTLCLLGLILMAGCATEFVAEPVVYYGWYGDYYGPYYTNPSGIIIFGAPYGWRGHYYYCPPRHYYPVPPPHRFEPPHHNEPHKPNHEHR